MLKMQNCCENETFTLFNNILVLAHFNQHKVGFFMVVFLLLLF